MSARVEVGDYELRVMGAEDRLIGQITDRVIDADRLCRKRMGRHGMPLWELYRAAYCGDVHCVPMLKTWAIGFAAAYGEAGGVRSDARSDELYGIAAWDALYRILYADWMLSAAEGGELSGVRDVTYSRLRGTLHKVWDAALRDYFGEMIISYASLSHAYRQ